ncbi:MAG: Spy/CpxP family protein refolding chaperone [candidate division Zixibacteria bacterium]|nr:Spy/CpxP family protein refolding chaperone [candidate division Zixibacteria bacterium]MBU1472066.1 Spy/CpxP family protein refolding chaperone [candidate division Zixibacteria bacterium]MBU2623940.1 Spy/CpxP family protein refolding chaperone [candidate division Zixibacteria bacterium]
MKRKLIIYALALLTIFNIATLATFGYHRWSLERDMQRFAPDDPGLSHIEELGLDSNQISAMKEARERFREESETVNSELFELQNTMFDLMHSDSPDTSAVLALVDSISAVQSVLHKIAIRHMLNEGNILTPEQREQLFNRFKNQLGKRWEKRRGMNRGKGMHRPPFGMNMPGGFGLPGGQFAEPCANPKHFFESKPPVCPDGRENRKYDRTDVTNQSTYSNETTDNPPNSGSVEGGM